MTPPQPAQPATLVGHRARSRRRARADRASGSFHDFSAVTADGHAVDFSEYRGRPVLVVNTATDCRFTGQMAGLQQLHRTYGPHGLVVLGFPSNEFGQDPGSDEDTEVYLRTVYDATFPLFHKTPVNGPDAPALWHWLAAQGGGSLGGRITWNFTKFLIGADGQLVRRFSPMFPPQRIAPSIENELCLGSAARP